MHPIYLLETCLPDGLPATRYVVAYRYGLSVSVRQEQTKKTRIHAQRITIDAKGV